MNTYSHSGLLGDIIYSLPTVKMLGGGNYLIHISKPLGVQGVPTQGRLLTIEQSKQMIDFLLDQSYIRSCKYWTGEKNIIDFDYFRGDPKLKEQHLVYSHYNRVKNWVKSRHGLTLGDLRIEPWIEAEPNPVADIVINISEREGQLDWHLLEDYDSKIFVGYESQYNRFKEVSHLNLPLYKTESIKELASVIAGSKLFIGSQSLCWALAEGMQKNRVLMVYGDEPNTLPLTNNGYTQLTEEMLKG